MKGKAGSKGGSQPESPASARSSSVDLAQFGVRTPGPTHSIHRCVSPACSVGGFFQTEGVTEEVKFK